MLRRATLARRLAVHAPVAAFRVATAAAAASARRKAGSPPAAAADADIDGGPLATAEEALAALKEIKPLKPTQIPKLEDAMLAGTKDSSSCTLILTEGDSAKALAVSGLGVLGRERFGVFPLKGKLMNVRLRGVEKITHNAELHHVRSILGLDPSLKYDTPEERKTLRYGKVMLMCDQDYDGSHIKGLFINALHFLWPSLLHSNDFLMEFITPIVKATRPGKPERVFFTVPEFHQWRASLPPGKPQWNVKYYKGLGTSTAAEAKEYFSDLDTHRLAFVWRAGETKSAAGEAAAASALSWETDGGAIQTAFGKDAALRREWLKAFKAGTFLDPSAGEVGYADFINKELILFSMADNVRSIPRVIDGLKPGQRKVLFGCFKRGKMNKEAKVAQLAGSVSEVSAYHHGEASLHSIIINMAQDFVGSNNVPLLVPSGQFGTRHMGGEDASSARYIFTKLDPLARLLFPDADDAVLPPTEEDGALVEPSYYVPVVPALLLNGCHGIGTGWSTEVPSFHPVSVCDAVTARLNGSTPPPLLPWWRGFSGTVALKGGRGAKKDDWRTTGVATLFDTWPPPGGIAALLPGAQDKEKKAKKKDGGGGGGGGAFGSGKGGVVVVSELPIGRRTDKYKEWLDEKRDARPPLVHAYRDESTDARVCLFVELTKHGRKAVEEKGLEQAMSLVSSVASSNMHAFNATGAIKKYNSPLEIIDDFIPVREAVYEQRKELQVARLKSELARLEARETFVHSLVAGTLALVGKPLNTVVAAMRASGLPAKSKLGEFAEEFGFSTSGSGEYDYLLSTQISALTSERIAGLKATTKSKREELARAQATKPVDTWRAELGTLRRAFVQRMGDPPK